MNMMRVVMSVSPDYLTYALVSVWSVMEHLAPDRELKLAVLHCGIDAKQTADFIEALQSWGTLSVEFINILPLAEKYGCTEAQIKRMPTCFPLLGDELFPDEDRMLALDSDMIVQTDLAELWDTPLDGALIAAVIDADFSGQMRSGNRNYKRYYREKASLADHAGYIQAGVVLYNLSAFRESFEQGQLFCAAIFGRYRYDDQDVLNMFCAGRIALLDMRWNVLHNNLNYRVPYIISLAEESIFREYIKSRKDPWIIHYAGCQKPWDDKNCDYAEAFWDVAARTPFFKRLEKRYKTLDRRALKRKTSLFRRAARFARYLFRKTRLNFMTRKFGHSGRSGGRY